MLRVARRLETMRPVRVKTSFLGAHAVPVEHAGQSDAYLDQVCLPALRAAHAEGLVDAVDGFCEGIGFSVAQIERLFQMAQKLNLPVKLHAEQLSHTGGCGLAARYRALSVDHVEYATDTDAAALAALLDNPFFDRRPPKSLDRNAFSASPVAGLSPADGAATLAAFTAHAVARAADHFPAPPKRWLVCGGGRHNPFMMDMLAATLKQPVAPVEAAGWDGDALEAQAFAYLAVRSLRGLALTFPTTTRANSSVAAVPKRFTRPCFFPPWPCRYSRRHDQSVRPCGH